MILDFLPEQLSIVFLAAIILLIPSLRKIFFAVTREGGFPASEPHERNQRLDAAKAIAMAAVIIVHGAYFFTTQEPETLPAAVRITNNLFRFAVPWFLIATGIVLPAQLATRRDIFRFWGRRFLRVGIPYLGMTMLIASSSREDALTTLQWIATGKALLPYYYILVLLQCYLLYPLLVRIRNEAWFLPSAFLLSFASFLIPSTWYAMGFPTVWQYLFFFCFGMSIRGSVLSEEPLMPTAHIAWGWIALLGGAMLIALPTQTYNASFFYGTALLRLFLALPTRFFAARFSSFLARLGTTTLFTYFTHLFVVSAVYWFFRATALTPTIRFLATLTIAPIGSMLIGYLYDSIRRL